MSAWFPIAATSGSSRLVPWQSEHRPRDKALDCEESDDEVMMAELDEWSEEDLGTFLALDALLEEERAERERAGVLGRWPFWEVRRWAVIRPDQFEQAAWLGIFAAGLALGLLWPILKSCLVSAVQVVWLACRFLVAVVAALRGASPVEF